jgi:hypothetical protein
MNHQVLQKINTTPDSSLATKNQITFNENRRFFPVLLLYFLRLF